MTLLTEKVIHEKVLVKTPEITSARLLAGPYLYSLFFAYRAIVGRVCWLILDGARKGRAIPWYRERAIHELFRSVFSEEEMKTFASLQDMWMQWVRETVEKKFQEAATLVIRGEELARELVQKARTIESAVEEMQAKNKIEPDKPPT